MKLQDQCTSLEISKRLKELGVEQNGYYSYVIDESWGKENSLKLYTSGFATGYPAVIACAFTVAELGEMLSGKLQKGYFIQWDFDGQLDYCLNGEYEGFDVIHSIDMDTEADARGLMLIYLLENKLITV